MDGLLHLLVLAMIPITAILAGAWTRSRKATEAGAARELEARFAELAAENAELRRRLEAVEVIVTDGEFTPPLPEEMPRSVAPRRRNRA